MGYETKVPFFLPDGFEEKFEDTKGVIIDQQLLIEEGQAIII